MLKKTDNLQKLLDGLKVFARMDPEKDASTQVPRKKTGRGLVFDHDQAGVIESLGGDFKKWQILATVLVQNIVEAEKKEDEGVEFKTRTEVLAEHITPEYLDRLGLSLTHPNHYFILGYIFSSVISTSTAQRSYRDILDPIGRILREKKVARA